MTHLNISPLNRRSFLSYVALGTLGLLTKELLDPASAMADSEGLGKNFSTWENYHIFVPYTTARVGGKQTFTLRSGEPCQVEIPSKAQDSQEITIKGRGQDGKDIRPLAKKICVILKSLLKFRSTLNYWVDWHLLKLAHPARL